MSTGVGQRAKEKATILKDYVDKAKKYEDEKDYSTLKLSEYLYEVKKNNAQVTQGFPIGNEGFKQFCGEYMRTGYHSAQSYIRIHQMVVNCAIDPAEAENLGYSKLRTITPITRPDNVNFILEQAKALNTNELEEFVKKYKKQMESGAPGDDADIEITVKRFVFPAADEEVTIINETLADVKGLLNTSNDTNALVHILQAYMEFVYPNERQQVLGQKSKKAEKLTNENKLYAAKDKGVESASTKNSPLTIDNVILEEQIPTASLPELLAFAKANNINIPTGIQSNKPKVKSLIIEHLAEAAPEGEPEAELIDELSGESDTIDTVDELDEPTIDEPFATASEVSEPVTPEKSEKPKKEKAPKAEKAPKEKKEKIKEEPEPEIEDPADTDGEAAALTIEEAIAEIRGVPDKKTLKTVAQSWGVSISAKDFKDIDTDTLVEMVVKAVCEANDEEYIAPIEEDNSDLDDMLAGE